MFYSSLKLKKIKLLPETQVQVTVSALATAYLGWRTKGSVLVKYDAYHMQKCTNEAFHL